MPGQRDNTIAGPRISAGTTTKLAGPTSDTKRAVLMATVDLIDRISYPSVTIDAVARASGVSKSTIYRYWPSRQALILEAYTYKTNRLTAVPDTGNAIDDLRTYLRKLANCLNFAGAASTVSGLIVDAIRDDEFALLYRTTLLRERRKTFLVILLKGQRRGQIRKDADLGTAIDAMYGAVHHRLLATGQTIDEPFISALTDMALRGLSTAHARNTAGQSGT